MIKKFSLTNNQLKIIAMVAMFLDHVGKMLLPQYQILQIIGRLAFPIFAFMIAEGCFYTKNKVRYFLTIFLLGAGCQAVYIIWEKSLYMNILLTFSLSIILIFGLENYKNTKEKRIKLLMVFAIIGIRKHSPHTLEIRPQFCIPRTDIGCRHRTLAALK